MNTRAGESGLAAYKRVNYQSRQVELHGQTEVGRSACITNSNADCAR